MYIIKIFVTFSQSYILTVLQPTFQHFQIIQTQYFSENAFGEKKI